MQDQEAASTATVNVAAVNVRTGADVSASAILWNSNQRY